jgi:uncharacterized protein
VSAALASVAALRAAEGTLELVPGPGTWEAFARSCESVDARGNVVADAYLAALAIEVGATWCTADRGFARFPGLRWMHPLDDGPI